MGIKNGTNASFSVQSKIFPKLEAQIYLPKVRYIIVVDPNGAGFLIFGSVFLGRSATLPNV